MRGEGGGESMRRRGRGEVFEAMRRVREGVGGGGSV